MKALKSIESKPADRAPIAYFHIVSANGKDMGWVGYCTAIGEAMLPALLHPDGVQAAQQRSLGDPPPVIGAYNGDAYVPWSWLRSGMKETRDLFVVDAMKTAAENAMKASNNQPPEAPQA